MKYVFYMKENCPTLKLDDLFHLFSFLFFAKALTDKFLPGKIRIFPGEVVKLLMENF